MLSPEGGQQIILDLNRVPANEALGTELLGDIEPVVADIEPIIQDYARWTELWNEIVRGGAK